MVDAHDSKSCLVRGGGSSPLSGTMIPKILVILGPTASGKSDIAVTLAQKFNGEVISADSRQVYKGLDIGTGKITKEEMGGMGGGFGVGEQVFHDRFSFFRFACSISFATTSVLSIPTNLTGDHGTTAQVPISVAPGAGILG